MDELRQLIEQGHCPTRCFFALLPPPDIAGSIQLLAQQHGLTIRAVPPRRYHVTLWISPDLLDPQPRLASSYIAAMTDVLLPACVVRLDMLCAGENWVGLGHHETLADVADLRHRIVGRMRRHGLSARPAYRFKPHITLAYDRRFRHTLLIPELSWLSTELVLIESWIGQTRHRILGRWPLGAIPRRLQYDLQLAS